MAGNKYLDLTTGLVTEKASNNSSAGAGDANKIVSLNSSGLIDNTMLPSSSAVTMTASENLAAGDLINIHDSSGAKVRKADASAESTRAHGFVIGAITSGSPGTVNLGFGINTGVSGLTIGANYFLSETSGAITVTAPTTSGAIVQGVGVAKAAAELLFIAGDLVVRA